jgi:hypothetical protein
MAEDRRVYCTGCDQTFITDAVGKCPLCGAVDALVSPEEAEVHIARKLAAREHEPMFDPRLAANVGLVSIGLMWKLLRIFAGGGAMVLLGIWLLFDPDIRGHKGAPRWDDILLGGPVLLLGIGLLGIGVYWIVRPKRL